MDTDTYIIDTDTIITESIYDERCSYKALHLDRQYINNGGLFPTNEFSTLAIWNIEGYSDIKQISVDFAMQYLDISILCIQETHYKESDYFASTAGSCNFEWMLQREMRGSRIHYCSSYSESYSQFRLFGCAYYFIEVTYPGRKTQHN